MKTALLLFFFNGCGLWLAAQRVDLDRFYFTASYVELPHRPLDTSYHTYSVQVETGALTKLAVKENVLQQQVVLDGWRKLAYDGDIRIHARLDDVMIEKSDMKERLETVKDKNGKQTGTRIHYSMQLTYSYAARVKVTDYKGLVVMNEVLATRENKRTYTSREFTSKSEAEIYFKYNIVHVTGEIMRQVTGNTMAQLSSMLTYNYGFAHRTVNDFMWILDSKKHPEYDDHRKAWLIVKQAMFQMHASEPLDKVRDMMQPAIAYFEKVKKRYAATGKSDRKLRYASFYNLAKIYYYLDDADATLREATGLELNDFDAKDGRPLQNAASDLKWLLQQNKVTGRHFLVYTEFTQEP